MVLVSEKERLSDHLPLSVDQTKAEMFKSVQLLLKSGAFINKTNNFGQNAFAMHIARRDPTSKEVAMLLFAGGEKLDTRTVNEYDHLGRALRHVDVPEYLQQPDVCLEHICREAIRKHLIKLNPHAHVFDRIPLLNLPSDLTDYLLYYMNLETQYDSDKESSTIKKSIKQLNNNDGDGS